MDIINIVYIDDIIDRGISKCLYKYKLGQKNIEYIEIPYTEEYTYKKLLEEIENLNINIVVIDSALYLESDSRERFTGEQFKIILKKILPYVETIVISQNKQENDWDIIKKFNQDIHMEKYKTDVEYYQSELIKVLEKKINEVKMGREIYSKLEEEQVVEKKLLEKISLSLSGEEKYSELKSEDINTLIESFQELKRALNGQK